MCVFFFFRTADGSCNNLNNPTWGMAGALQKRYLPAAYGKFMGGNSCVAGDSTANASAESIADVHC